MNIKVSREEISQKDLLISFVIPVFNMEKDLRRCIDSVLGQPYRSVELVIVDDGSTDKSVEIASKFADLDPRVRVLVQENAGVSNARNVGLKHARGTYIGFLDADDWLIPDSLGALVDLLNDSNPDCLRAHYETSDGSSRTKIATSLTPGLSDTPESIYDLAKKFVAGSIPGYAWLFLIRRTLAVRCRFDERLPFMEDCLFVVDALALSSTVAVTDHAFYCYYLNDDGASKGAGRSHRNILSAANAGSLLVNRMKCFAGYSDEDGRSLASRRGDLLGRQIASSVARGLVSRHSFSKLVHDLGNEGAFISLTKESYVSPLRSKTFLLLILIRVGRTEFAWMVALLASLAIRVRSLSPIRNLD